MTKPSEHFRDTIREYLEQRAGADALFAASCAKEHKNLDDCITFILNYVQQSGCNGFTDAEIYSLAVHYYDEDDIDVGRPLDCRVVVNHTIVLTEEEQREAHEQALRKATEEAYAKITHKSKSQPASNAANAANQQSLFLSHEAENETATAHCGGKRPPAGDHTRTAALGLCPSSAT